jgi:hypothetical protein
MVETRTALAQLKSTLAGNKASVDVNLGNLTAICEALQKQHAELLARTPDSKPSLETAINSRLNSIETTLRNFSQLQARVHSSECSNQIATQLPSVIDRLDAVQLELKSLAATTPALPTVALIESIQKELQALPTGLSQLGDMIRQSLPHTDRLDAHHPFVKEIHASLMDLKTGLSSLIQLDPRPRSVSPSKRELFQEERLVEVQSTLHAVRDSVAELARGRRTAADPAPSKQVQGISDACEDIRRLQNHMNEVLLSSDQAWRAELRQSVRFDHEKLVAIERMVQGISDQSNNPSMDIMAKRLQEVLTLSAQTKQHMSSIESGLTNDVTTVIESAVDRIQAEIQMNNATVKSLLQDREALMHENQRLLNTPNVIERLSAFLDAQAATSSDGKVKQEEAELTKSVALLESKRAFIQSEIDRETKRLESMSTVKSKVDKDAVAGLTSEVAALERELQVRVKNLLEEISSLQTQKKVQF